MPQITFVKKGAKKAAGKVGAPGDFVLQDNGDDSVTVFGVDKAGQQADISAVAAITVTSSDTAKLTVDPPVGMTYQMHAVGPIGDVVVTIVATWTDGSVGPFTAADPVAIQTGPAAGLIIVHGTPTVH